MPLLGERDRRAPIPRGQRKHNRREEDDAESW